MIRISSELEGYEDGFRVYHTYVTEKSRIIARRIAFDEHKRFKEYINKFAAADIPIDDEDEASAIVCRYLLYMEKLNISPEDSLHGLIEIFLTNAIRGEASVLERRSTERKRE